MNAPKEVTYSLLLVTLDTTRADALGLYAGTGNGNSPTPVLDALARRGMHYRQAITSAPLTLPAHASLFTGRTPPGHGVHDNATEALAHGIPTLASTLHSRGFATGAVVASRVLDRRFGLDQGFDHYDDRPAAEKVGEHGYAERTGEEVTELALRWLAETPKDRPFFLWVHYYDPHAPYTPPDAKPGESEAARYQKEVSHCDRQVGRLLDALPKNTLTAIVGDHGEALGEHGEPTHGLFLYRSVLEVPMILAGPGVPAGARVDPPVATRRLASSLLALLGVAPKEHRIPGPVLPGLGLEGSKEGGVELPEALSSGLIYSETVLPATAYGWSPLHAITGERHRFIMAPKPELYDFARDPGEQHNRLREERATLARLRAALEQHEALHIEVTKARTDGDLRREISQLGYLSGASGRGGKLDPKDGIQLLEKFRQAKELNRQGRSPEAAAKLEVLVRQNPGNVPFLTQLAAAYLQSGQIDRGLATYRAAIAANPDYEFPRLRLASALQRLGRGEEARREFEAVLELDPRLADAWLALAQLALQRGDQAEERRLLETAADRGTASAGLFVRLGQLRAAANEEAGALEAFEQASRLAPRWPLVWLIKGQVEHRLGHAGPAQESLRKVLELAPSSREAQQARRLLQQR